MFIRDRLPYEGIMFKMYITTKYKIQIQGQVIALCGVSKFEYSDIMEIQFL